MSLQGRAAVLFRALFRQFRDCGAFWDALRPLFMPHSSRTPSSRRLVQSSCAPFFLRFRSNRASAARVGVAIPDAAASRVNQASYSSPVSRRTMLRNAALASSVVASILASVVRTARQRGLDLNDLFTTLLQAPRPMVPATFKPAAQ